jgi:hypothetical protein
MLTISIKKKGGNRKLNFESNNYYAKVKTW